MKKLVTLLGIAILVAAIAVPVLAHGPGWGKGRHMMGYGGGGSGYCGEHGKGYWNLTDEQRTELNKLRQRFFDETVNLRSEIWAKSGELNILLNSSTPDAERVRALQKEVSDLRARMAQKRVDFVLESRKIAPDARLGRGYGMGYGPHMRGYGPGMGPGWHTRGRGPGGCWN